jgi:hypothetical protein
MKKYPHEIFIEENKEEISKKPVPALLKKRLNGFDELLADLPHTIGKDREVLEDKLDDLSQELLEDLEEHYELDLENNELPEEEYEERVKTPQSQHEPDYSRNESEYVPEEAQLHETQSEQEEAAGHRHEPMHEISETVPSEMEDEFKDENFTEPIPEPSDEDLLTDIYNAGFKQIHPSMLKNKGYKSHLHKRSIEIGKFHLKRGKYDTHYTIYLKSDE